MNIPSPRLANSPALTTESPIGDLTAIIRSRTPLISVETSEEPQIVQLVRQIGKQLNLKAYRWTITDGMQAFETCDQPNGSVLKSQEVLNFIKNTGSYSLFVLLDFQPYLQDALHVRYLKDIALSYARHFSTVVMVGASLQVPEDLRPFTARFCLPLPTAKELRGIVSDVAADWASERSQTGIQTTNKTLDMLVRNLTGLTATDARRLAQKAINDNGAIEESDLPVVMQAKYELLGRDSLLSFEYETAQFADIGGMRRLRQWLEVRKSFFLDGPVDHLDPPRGLLLLGVQGCGKSLAAKAAAGIFSAPLLRLDFSTLYSKYYGETEKNLRKAFETAEVMAPCVLWLDEIEKGLATGDDDDGLSRRLLGTLLTWMSERKEAVFIVATANDISRLPPEVVRKGRFDEIFFVDLPAAENRKDILSIHLRKRCQDPAKLNLEELAVATDGFSGSEIEQAVVSAMYTTHAQGSGLTQAALLGEIKQTRPLSVLLAEKVEDLREWAKERTVPCD